VADDHRTAILEAAKDIDPHGYEPKIYEIEAHLDSLIAERDRYRKQAERWQAVAFIDGADVTARARAEGIAVETGREPAFREFLREFYAKPDA